MYSYLENPPVLHELPNGTYALIWTSYSQLRSMVIDQNGTVLYSPGADILTNMIEDSVVKGAVVENSFYLVWQDYHTGDSPVAPQELYMQKLDTAPMGIEENSLPENFITCGNYPNPFNPTTTISFSLPVNKQVKMSIYNIKGQLVNTLTDEYMLSGNHSVIWAGEDKKGSQVSSGIYFYKISTPDTSVVGKMVMVK
ncbi:MAG: T9SS type A sorting domain-containing protein [Candidatus Cloacimonetes bacterium]|nr:T9SS type A sorting domain-containing protein [Candidatus Cloacimonadota bacterium]